MEIVFVPGGCQDTIHPRKINGYTPLIIKHRPILAGVRGRANLLHIKSPPRWEVPHGQKIYRANFGGWSA